MMVHYGNKPMKCVNFTLYLFIKVIIEFNNLIVILNQQGTLRIVHGRVDPSIYHLIRIFNIEAQSAILGKIPICSLD